MLAQGLCCNEEVLEGAKGDFPGGPVVRTPRFQCKGRGFNTWSGELRSHMPHGMAKKKKKKLLPRRC